MHCETCSFEDELANRTVRMQGVNELFWARISCEPVRPKTSFYEGETAEPVKEANEASVVFLA